MIELSEQIEDPNPEIKTYRREKDILVVERTHPKPVIHTESHSIREARDMIAKFDGVIALWEAKKAPYQKIIDKYDSLEK